MTFDYETKKIAIIGTHNLGKTDFAVDVYRFLPYNNELVINSARNMEIRGVKLGEDSTFADQIEIIEEQINQEQLAKEQRGRNHQKPSFIITDTSVIDLLVYMEYHSRHNPNFFDDNDERFNGLNHWRSRVSSHLKKEPYYRLFFATLDPKERIEGFRKSIEDGIIDYIGTNDITYYKLPANRNLWKQCVIENIDNL
jgi:hypothetical protein